MFKGKKKRNNFIDFKNETALHKSNNVHEKTFNPRGNWIGTISAGSKNYTITAQNVTKKEAKDAFEQEARLCGGKLDSRIGKLK